MNSFWKCCNVSLYLPKLGFFCMLMSFSWVIVVYICCLVYPVSEHPSCFDITVIYLGNDLTCFHESGRSYITILIYNYPILSWKLRGKSEKQRDIYCYFKQHLWPSVTSSTGAIVFLYRSAYAHNKLWQKSRWHTTEAFASHSCVAC